MKMYKIAEIVQILTESREIGTDLYCGFEINDKGNLVVVLKEHDPDYPEAVQEIELLKDEGEY